MNKKTAMYSNKKRKIKTTLIINTMSKLDLKKYLSFSSYTPLIYFNSFFYLYLKNLTKNILKIMKRNNKLLFKTSILYKFKPKDEKL